MKLLKTLTAVLCVVGFAVLIGACAVQDYITPCYIDKRAAEYTGAELKEVLPFTTIADAKRLGKELNYIHTEKREAFLQEVKKDGRLHSFLVNSMKDNLIDAKALQETLFSPTGVFGALTGLLGLGAGAMFIKRPQDIRPEDVEEA